MRYTQSIICAALLLFSHTANTESVVEHPVAERQMAESSVYLIGTYTTAKNQGIELVNFDQVNQLLSTKVLVDGLGDPSFLIANRAKTQIFSVEDGVNGTIVSFAFNQQAQSVTLINKVNSYGDHPCYLALDTTERLLAVANYSSGNFSIYALDGDGRLHFKQTVQLQGKSVNKQRQNQAHVHSMLFHPNGKQLLVADLGSDKIHIYDVDDASATPITAATPADFSVAAGSGPRHMVIHPNGKWLYLVHELTGEVGVYFYQDGQIAHANTYSLITSKFKAQMQAAEIRLSSDARFIYVSNRGNANNLNVFKIGLEGDLSLIQQIATGGETPRNFNLSPDGHFLLAANQNSDDVRLFKRNPISGLLSATSSKINIKRPVYVLSLY